MPAPTPSATPTLLPTPSPTPTPGYGPLNVSPTALQIDKKRPYGAFTVQQSGPSGRITISSGAESCNGDISSLSVLPASAPIGANATTINVSARGHGASDPNGSCALRVQGGGGMATTVNVSFGKGCNGKDESNNQCGNAVGRAPAGIGAPHTPGALGLPTAPPSAPAAPAGTPASSPSAPARAPASGPGAAPGRPGAGSLH